MPPKGKPENIFTNANVQLSKASNGEAIALQMTGLYDKASNVCTNKPSEKFSKPNRPGGMKDEDYKKLVFAKAKDYIGRLKSQCGNIDPSKASIVFERYDTAHSCIYHVRTACLINCG
jgi:hypothetical protein